MLIYEPKGKAREYSPLALNIYKGCDHGCTYCYVPQIFHFDKNYRHDEVTTKVNFIATLKKEASRFKGEKKQVLLSFTSDPYCTLNDELNLTRKSLEILLENKFPAAILTKGGSNCLKDLGLFEKFGEHIKVGATLTFSNDKDGFKTEPNAMPISDRMETLKYLHKKGIYTWASLEPVIDPVETLRVIHLTKDFVDEYKVGKLNHQKSDINWEMFAAQATVLLREYGKKHYIKKDLAEQCKIFQFSSAETDMDYLTLKAWG